MCAITMGVKGENSTSSGVPQSRTGIILFFTIVKTPLFSPGLAWPGEPLRPLYNVTTALINSRGLDHEVCRHRAERGREGGAHLG